MTAETILSALCHRAGLPEAYAAHLAPAVQKALSLPPAQRDAMLALVEQDLVLRADGLAAEEAKYAHLDEFLILAVARALHAWTPDEGLLETAASPARFDGRACVADTTVEETT